MNDNRFLAGLLDRVRHLLDKHASRHENGGPDEMNVTGLPGVLTDPQPPAAHTHAGGDVTSAVANATEADTLDGNHASAFAAADATYGSVDAASAPADAAFADAASAPAGASAGGFCPKVSVSGGIVRSSRAAISGAVGAKASRGRGVRSRNSSFPPLGRRETTRAGTTRELLATSRQFSGR